MQYHGDPWSWVPDSRFAASGLTAQQYPAQPLRRDRQLGDDAGNTDRIVDRGGDRRADRIGAAFAGALETQEIQRTRRVLGDQYLDRRHFVRGRNEIIGESDRERLAALVIDELLEQRAAEPLNRAAGELALDQHRVDRLADVVGDEIALDLHAAGVAVDPHYRDVNAIRIGHVIGA